MAVSSRQHTPVTLTGDLLALPPEATTAHLLPDLEPTLCFRLLPCSAWFTQDSVTIFNNNSLKLLTGPREDSQGIWQLQPVSAPATGPAGAPGDSSSGLCPPTDDPDDLCPLTDGYTNGLNPVTQSVLNRNQ